MKAAAILLLWFPAMMLIIFLYCCLVFAASLVLIENPFHNVHRVLSAFAGPVGGSHDR